MHSQQAIRQRSVHLHPCRAMVWNRAMVPSPSSGRRATLTHAGSGASWVTLPIPGSSPAGGGTWVWGRPANLPAEVVGFEQAREGHTGWGPESYILIIRTREKDMATTQSGATARTQGCTDRRPSGSQHFPGRGRRESAGGGAARDTWCGPRASSGRRGGV